MPRTREECRNCGDPADGRQSLPIDNNCDFVPVTSKAPWSGVPACKVCVDLFAGAGDAGPRVLEIYANARAQQRQENIDILGALRAIRSEVDQLPDV